MELLMRCRAVPILLLPLLLAACLTPRAIKESEGHRTLALTYIQEGNTPAAISSAKLATENNPWDREAWQTLGLAYFAAEIHDAAEKAFLKSVKLDPEFSQVRVNLGSLYLSTERWEEAIEHLEVAAGDPEYRQPVRALHNLGWAWFNRGDNAKAREYYVRVLKRFPLFCPAHLNLGLVEEAEGKVEEALARYRAAWDCDPRDLKALLNLGIAEGRLDLISDACEHLGQVRDADPVGEFRQTATDYWERLQCTQGQRG